MSKSLSILQTIAKVAKIVCKVIFILCIVGAVGSLVGLVVLSIFGPLFVGGGGHQFMDKAELMSGIFGCVTGLIVCAGEAIHAYHGERYFTHELEAGTPFTQEGAKEIFRLGILSLIVSAAASVLSGIVFGIFLIFYPEMSDIYMTMSWSLGTGLALLLLSVIFRYGAELRDQHSEPKTEWTPPYEESKKEAPHQEEPIKEEPTADGQQADMRSFDVL